MAIPSVIILGLACTFYIYVAVRWWRAIMLAKQEGRRASAIVRLSTGMEAAPLWYSRELDVDHATKQTGYGNRGVIVMSRARVGK
jgi:hypothetical protein